MNNLLQNLFPTFTKILSTQSIKSLIKNKIPRTPIPVVIIIAIIILLIVVGLSTLGYLFLIYDYDFLEDFIWLLIFLIIGFIVSGFGLIKMKKWALYLFALLSLFTAFILILYYLGSLFAGPKTITRLDEFLTSVVFILFCAFLYLPIYLWEIYGKSKSKNEKNKT